MLGQAWGAQGLTAEEFDWWFERNPDGSVLSVARMDGQVVGAAAHTLHRMVIGGEERLMGFACHAVTDPVARGLGHLHRAPAASRGAAEALGSSVVLGLRQPGRRTRCSSACSAGRDLAHYRIWARPARGGGETPPPAELEVEGDAAAGWVNHVVRDTRSPRVAVPGLAARVRAAALGRAATQSSGRTSRTAAATIGVVSDLVGAREGDARPPPPGGEGLAGSDAVRAPGARAARGVPGGRLPARLT